MTYTVKYKRIGSLFWNKLSGLRGDGLCTDHKGNILPIRFFITDKEERLEVSTENMIFYFDTNRYLRTKMEMEKEVGHKLTLNSKVGE